MQERAERAEEAGAWLRKNLKDKSEPKIDISWSLKEERDDAGFARFLAALFTPADDSPTP
jgi:hypothetical protein